MNYHAIPTIQTRTENIWKHTVFLSTMGKGKQQSKKKAGGGKSSSVGTGESFAMIDPNRIRFQHSKIRPYFSGCGRSVRDTLEEIRQGKLSPDALPPIQVIAGVGSEDEGWYFSLNNRRLWVLKRCREEGLLLRSNNEIKVRVRAPKSSSEAERYSVRNCALEAKFLRERCPLDEEGEKHVEETHQIQE